MLIKGNNLSLQRSFRGLSTLYAKDRVDSSPTIHSPAAQKEKLVPNTAPPLLPWWS